MSADKNTAAIGFEQKIWEVADEASLGAMTYNMPEPHYVMAAKRGEGYR